MPLATIIARVQRAFREGESPMRPGGKVGAAVLCPRNLGDRAVVGMLEDLIMERPGRTLLEKIPYEVPQEIQDLRAEAGVGPVDRTFRDTVLKGETSQTPQEWIANLAYWGAYPLGPIQIPSLSHECAIRWIRIFEWINGGRLNRPGLR